MTDDNFTMPDEQKPTNASESTIPPPETAPVLPETEAKSENTAETAAKASFKETMDKFYKKHLKGERLPSEEETDISRTEALKHTGISMIGVAASIGGVKLLADLPRWLVQKYYTTQEQKRLSSVFEAGEAVAEKAEKEETGDAIKEKAAALEKAIDDSKYLSAVQKEKLKTDMRGVQDRYDQDLTMTRKGRAEAVAKLLDETIQTRVKGVTVVKEAINSVLWMTQLSTLRAAGYGAVSVYERYQKVSKEKKEGKRTESLAKELVVNGFKETWSKLSFKGEGTKKEKVLAATAAVGTIMRFVGIGGAAFNEMAGRGVSEAIDGMLSAWEQKSAAEFVSDNFEANLQRATAGLFGKSEIGGSEIGDREPVVEEPDGGVEKAAVVSREVSDVRDRGLEVGESDGGVEEAVDVSDKASDAGVSETTGSGTTSRGEVAEQVQAPDAGVRPEADGGSAQVEPAPEATPEDTSDKSGAGESDVSGKGKEISVGKEEAEVVVSGQEKEELKEALKASIVKRGDGATQAALRGLKPEELKHYGLENASPKRLAAFMRDAMKNTGMSSEDHLTRAAIGNVSFRVEEISGKPELVAYDLQSLKQIPKEALFSQKLMEHVEPPPIEQVPEPEVSAAPSFSEKEKFSTLLKSEPEYRTPQEEIALEKAASGMEKRAGGYGTDKETIGMPKADAAAEAPEVSVNTSEFTLANAVVRESVSAEKVGEIDNELRKARGIYQEVIRKVRDGTQTQEDEKRVAQIIVDLKGKYGAVLQKGWEKKFLTMVSGAGESAVTDVPTPATVEAPSVEPAPVEAAPSTPVAPEPEVPAARSPKVGDQLREQFDASRKQMQPLREQLTREPPTVETQPAVAPVTPESPPTTQGRPRGATFAEHAASAMSESKDASHTLDTLYTKGASVSERIARTVAQFKDNETAQIGAISIMRKGNDLFFGAANSGKGIRLTEQTLGRLIDMHSQTDILTPPKEIPDSI